MLCPSSQLRTLATLTLVAIWLTIGCQKQQSISDFGGDTSDYSALKSELDAVKKILTVDPTTLEVYEVTAVNMPTAGGNSYDLAVSINAHPKAQMLKVSICGDSGVCKEIPSLRSSLRVEAVSLPSQNLTIKVAACVHQSYSSSKDSQCGPDKTITHTLPDNSQDPLLQAYEQELLGIQAAFSQWDGRVTTVLKEYQQDIDKCFEGNKKSLETQVQRQWAGLASLVLMMPFEPSKAGVPSSGFAVETDDPGLSTVVSDASSLAEAQDFEALSEGKACVDKGLKDGKGAVVGLCGVGTLIAVKDKIQSYHKTLDKVADEGGIGAVIGNKVNTYKNILSDPGAFDFAGLTNHLLGPPRGSVTGFAFGITQAIYDLVATRVILPCGTRQHQKDYIDKVFIAFLQSNRINICMLHQKVIARRAVLGLEPPEVDICVEVTDELKKKLEGDSSQQDAESGDSPTDNE